MPLNPPHIECPRCGLISFNLNDIEKRFCAVCGFHDDFDNMRSAVGVPGTVKKIDLASGKEKVEGMTWGLLPPGRGKCPICAVPHRASQPHNTESMFYRVIFNGVVGRLPTWADAMAHCDEDTRRRWEDVLREMGRWTQPEAGVAPVKHHGVEP